MNYGTEYVSTIFKNDTKINEKTVMLNRFTCDFRKKVTIAIAAIWTIQTMASRVLVY